MSSNKILSYSLTILLLAMSVNYSLLNPITTTQPPSNATPSQSIADQATTTQPPPPESRNISGCNCEWRDDSESCVSLEEAIFQHFDSMLIDQDTPYPFFTLQDLFYSAIFNTTGVLRPDPLETSPRDLIEARRRCQRLVRKYNAVKSSGSCQWSYNCTQRQDQFPSFYVEAEFVSGTSECMAVTMKNQRFVKTPCSASNGTQPHWLVCKCGEVITSYKDMAAS